MPTNLPTIQESGTRRPDSVSSNSHVDEALEIGLSDTKVNADKNTNKNWRPDSTKKKGFTTPKGDRRGSKEAGRKNSHHKVDYNHAPDHKTHYRVVLEIPKMVTLKMVVDWSSFHQ